VRISPKSHTPPYQLSVRAVRFLLAAAALSLRVACGGDDPVKSGPPDREGPVSVITVTTGAPSDPDGYTVMLDDAVAGAIGVNDEVELETVRGHDRTLQLSGFGRQPPGRRPEPHRERWTGRPRFSCTLDRTRTVGEPVGPGEPRLHPRWSSGGGPGRSR
jgi:hypothetical protein